MCGVLYICELDIIRYSSDKISERTAILKVPFNGHWANGAAKHENILYNVGGIYGT